MRAVSRTKIMEGGLSGNKDLPRELRDHVLVDYLINLMGGEKNVQKLITHQKKISAIEATRWSTPSLDEIIQNESRK